MARPGVVPRGIEGSVLPRVAERALVAAGCAGATGSVPTP
jgi:hypothetical protein